MSRAVLHNSFCDAWGIEVPIFLAGMGVGGRATPPALVAAVSQAGGLVKGRRPAKDIMADLVDGAAEQLRRLQRDVVVSLP